MSDDTTKTTKQSPMETVITTTVPVKQERSDNSGNEKRSK